MEYLEKTYDYEGRFNSYYHQIMSIINVLPIGGNVLEIGPGNGFVTDYLRKRGISIDTLDICSETRPTYIGDITNLPLENNSYDCVAAFEVLEHLPFEKAKVGISEMIRVSKKYIIVSVPDVRWYVYFNVKFLTKRLGINKLISIPRLYNRKIDNQRGSDFHYWEIGRKNYTIKDIKNVFEGLGLNISNYYRVTLNPVHHMFIMFKETNHEKVSKVDTTNEEKKR